MNRERKHYKVNTSTFDNIEENGKNEFSSLINKIMEDITNIQDTLTRKAVIKLIRDYTSLNRRFWVFLIGQFIINILLCVAITLK